MFRFLRIIWTSFKMALQELRSNKLRTFLSLLGITFGIFCIISVLSVITSMELAVKTELKSIAARTVFVGKWENGGGTGLSLVENMKRPEVKYNEMKLVEEKSPNLTNIAYLMGINDKVEYGDNIMSGINYYGVSEKFFDIQSVKISTGRYFHQEDYDHGYNYIIIGNVIAEELFGKAENAIGKVVKLKNDKDAVIVGLIEKQGKSLFNAFDYDHSILLTYTFFKQIEREENAGPNILVQGTDAMSIEALKDELKGDMRSIRKLKPTEDDNFSLTDIDSATKDLDSLINGMDIGGWAIAGLSLLVGMFGVANIMFVTVRERTSQIGLKKAIGAPRSTILTEFLLNLPFCVLLVG